MKLFTNLGNSSALKVLISANFGGKKVNLEVVEVDGKPVCLYYLLYNLNFINKYWLNILFGSFHL